MILFFVVFLKVILVLLRITIVYSFPFDEFLHFKSLLCCYFCHNNTFAFVYYCIVCIFYQHNFWIILFCVIIIFYPLFIVSLSMILFVTKVLKNIYSTNIIRITSKNEFFSFEKCTSFGLLPLRAKHSGLCESNSRTWFESSLKQGTSQPHLQYHQSLLIFIAFLIILMTFMAIFLLIWFFYCNSCLFNSCVYKDHRPDRFAPRVPFLCFVFSHSRSLCFIIDHCIPNGIMQFRSVYINENKNENRIKDNNNGMSENHSKNQQTFHNVSMYYIYGTELW